MSIYILVHLLAMIVALDVAAILIHNLIQFPMERCSFLINYAKKLELKGYYIRDFILFGDVLYDLYKMV